MKQKLTSYFSAAIVMVMIVLFAKIPSKAVASLPGDLNCDDCVTVSDSILLARLVAEDPTLELSEDGLANADMNEDGKTDSDDVTYSLKYLANLITDEQKENSATTAVATGTSITTQTGTFSTTTVTPQITSIISTTKTAKRTTSISKTTSQAVSRTTATVTAKTSSKTTSAKTTKTTKATTKTTVKTTKATTKTTIKTTRKTTKTTTKVTTKTTAKTTKKTTTRTTAKTSYGYVCNTSKSSHKFHRIDCPSVARMNDSNKLYVSSREEAISMGYEPCQKCNP